MLEHLKKTRNLSNGCHKSNPIVSEKSVRRNEKILLRFFENGFRRIRKNNTALKGDKEMIDQNPLQKQGNPPKKN